MANQQLYIPSKLKLGFQKREDTYSGMLAYLIYFDDKGVLRKEKSWQSWRDKKLPPQEVQNEPTDGFVLNKKVGGYRCHWNYRDAHVRVWDPRGFEFEISVPNLLFILTQCDCSKGKGLEGKFVYAWEGTELVLLPVGSEEYQKSSEFTKLQAKTVTGKELIPGATYTTKSQESLLYLGRFDYHYCQSARYGRSDTTKAQRIKRYVFWDAKPLAHSSSKVARGFVYLDDLKKVACLQSDAISDELATLVSKYHKSSHGTKVVRLFLKECDPKDSYEQNLWHYEYDGGFLCCRTERGYGVDRDKIWRVAIDEKYTLKDGVLYRQRCSTYTYPPGKEKDSYYHLRWLEPTNHRLYAELESGATFKLDYGTLTKD